MDELKPCPFCGGEARIKEYKDVEFLVHNADCYMAQCDNCGCGTSYEPTKLDVRVVWNRRAARENKPLTLEQLRQLDGDWVWLVDTERSEYNGWYNVRPFHDGSAGIELYGVDNNYYERAITSDSIKVYAHKPEREANDEKA